MRDFYGRREETEEFLQLFRKKTSSLVTCQGRRRVGKSTFIRQCAAHAGDYWAFSGLAPREGGDQAAQLAAFGAQLAQLSKMPELPLESWPAAFHWLARLLPKDRWIVVLFDEISWMAQGCPDFAGYLKTAWDDHFSRHPRLILVLCGSVSSWIEQNILNSTGFVGRCSWQFWLDPLPVRDCMGFWGKKSSRIAVTEKLQILSVTGGIPRYLEEIDPSQTAAQNIERLCFNKAGMLLGEFEQLFHDLFNRRASTHREIVRQLIAGRRSVEQLSQALKRERGGSLSESLRDLELAGFIKRDVAFDPDSARTQPRAIRYRLSDNYVRFYLKYVEPQRERILKGLYQWTPLEALEAWDTIMGFQFENLVLNNLEAIRKKAGIANVPVVNAGPYWQEKTLRREACQIDLLVRTSQSLHVFETRLRQKIDASVIDEVKEKVRRLKLPRDLSVRTGLIYHGELASGVVEADYFDHLIPFADLTR